MMRTKRSGWLTLVLALLLVVALFLTTYFRQSRTLTGFEQLYMQTTQTPAQGFSALGRGVKSFFTWMFDWQRLQEERDAYRDEAARLRAQNQMLEENVHLLEDQLTLQGAAQAQEDYQFLAAHISARDNEGLLNRFLIDKGSSAGVEVGMCVVGEFGLVGRVTQVGPNYARVGTILDPTVAVSVVCERSRDEGVLKGLQTGGDTRQRCELMYLPFDADLVPGDRVVTTDLGGIYPRGLQVGTVVEVGLETDANVTALVEPTEDFARLENVLVILAPVEEVTVSGDLP